MSMDLNIEQASKTPNHISLKIGAAWAVKHDAGAQWYWGKVCPKATAHYGEAMLDPLTQQGPFNTAADAGLDMIRSWVEDSAARADTALN